MVSDKNTLVSTEKRRTQHSTSSPCLDGAEVTHRGHQAGIREPRIYKAALLTRAERWKQPECPLMVEQVNEVWFTHTVGYYSAFKS